MMNYRCTFTGVDEQSSFSEIEKLTKRFPFIEWGILYSKSKSGNDNRYPSLDFIKSFGYFCKAKKISNALHVCGEQARTLMLDSSFELDNKFIKDTIFSHNLFNRVQVNVNLSDPNHKYGIGIMDRLFYLPKLILQYNENNAEFIKNLQRPLWNYGRTIDVLIDGSLGLGKEITDFSVPDLSFNHALGFAGGINPENILNILQQLPKADSITNVSTLGIDVESGIRTNDVLSLEKCEFIAEHFKNYYKL